MKKADQGTRGLPVDRGTDSGSPLIVLHRLSLERSKLQFLLSNGLEVKRASSVKQTCALVEECTGAVVVVINLSIGSASPETIFRFLRQRGSSPEAASDILACTTRTGNTLRRRALALGVDEVFMWPEGVFTELIRRFSSLPRFHLRRVAERARVEEPFGDEDDAVQGTLVNLSATGAMLEVDRVLDVGDSLSLRLQVPGADAPTTILGTVVWCEAAGSRARAGVTFRLVSEAMQQAIERFVHDLNVIRFASSGQIGSGATHRTPVRRQKVRVNRLGDARVDYFALEGDLDETAVLVPRKAFFVPFQVGDQLEVRVISSKRNGAQPVRIIERRELERDRVDSRVAWVVQRE